MPAKVFFTSTWPGCREGSGWSVLYSKTEGGPVLGVRIADMVLGAEVAILQVVVAVVVML